MGEADLSYPVVHMSFTCHHKSIARMTAPSPWRSIVASTKSLMEAVDRHLIPSQTQVDNGWPAASTEINLPLPTSESLRQALSERNLSADAITNFCQLQDEKMQYCREAFAERWRQFAKEVGSTIEAAVIEQIRFAKIQKYGSYCKELENQIIAIVDASLRRRTQEALTSAQSEAESSSEDGLLIPRGHSRLAVIILEKAFARTTNISRAEKLRLAAATKLQPRQITIWFQNRRNRKTVAQTKEYKLQAAEAGAGSATSKKRKADGLYDGEIRRPSQRLRPTTPDRAVSICRGVHLSGASSISSLTSSKDSLASLGMEDTSETRNYSTDPSTVDSYDATSPCKEADRKKVSPSCFFDDQVQGHNKDTTSDFDIEEDISNSMLFSATGMPQLDLDDLGLELDSLIVDMPSLDMEIFSFATPSPSAVDNGHEARPLFGRAISPMVDTPSPRQATTPSVAAGVLNELDVDPFLEVRQAHAYEDWSSGWEALFGREETDGEDEIFLDLKGLTGTGLSPLSSDSKTVDEESNVPTPADLFDFSLSGMHIDEVMSENLDTYFQATSSKANESFGLLKIDVDIANRSAIVEENRRTARPPSQDKTEATTQTAVPA